MVDKVTTMAAEFVFSVDAQKSFFLHLRSSSLFSITKTESRVVSQKRSSSVASLHLRLVDSDVVHLGAVEGGDILVIFVEIEGLPENTLSPSDHQLLSFWRCNCPQGRLGQRTANQRDGPHLHPILTTNFSQDISQISHNMLKICQRYAQDMPEICSRYAKDMPNISPKYAKICLIYHQNISIYKIFLKLHTHKKH